MGAKTEMLAFVAGDVAEVLRRGETSDPLAAEELVRRLAPGWQVEPIEGEVLAEATYPPADTVYVLSVPDLDLICGLDFLRCGGSALPEHILAEAAGRAIAVHRMHSGSCGFEIALWKAGTLVRAVGINGVMGVVEDLGEPLPFEVPFWAGQHPYEPERFVVGAGPSPFPTPFHPLDMGNKALRALFGFTIKGSPSPDDVDPWTVRLHGFRITDPARPSLAEQLALRQNAVDVGTLTSCRMEKAPDGRIILVPVELTSDSQQA